ncbi:MAG: TolC family protein [Bacillota bacterium]
MKINKLTNIIIMVILTVMIAVPAVLAEEKIELNTALNSALENNRILSAAEEKLKAAVKQNTAAESIMNSKLRGELAWKDEELSEDGNIFTTLNYSKFLAKSKGTAALLDSAELKLITAQLEYNNLRDKVLADVIKQYYNLLKLQKLVEKQEAAVEEAEALYKDARLRYQDSLITRSDFLHMEINLDKKRQALKSLENSVLTSQDQFKRLTGIQNEKIILKEEKIFKNEIDFPFIKKELLKIALNNRSDFQIQQLNSDLIKADINYIKSEEDPVFSVGGEYIYDDGKVEASVNSKYQLNLDTTFDTAEKDEMFISLKDMQLLEESEWKITAAVSYEFSDGGKKDAEIEAAEANLNENKIKLEDLEKEIEIEISQLVRKLEENRENIEIAEKNFKKAELEFQSTKNRYDKGAVTASDLISAQKLLIDAESETVEAEYEYQLKITELLAAVQNIYESFSDEKLGGDM